MNILSRFSAYRLKRCEGQVKLYHALSKHGVSSFDFEIIQECPESELDAREIFWINFYDSIRDGYNSIQGGRRRRNYNDLSTREKISKANTGRVQSPEEIMKRANSLRGLKRDVATKERIRQNRIGKKHKPETIEKIKNTLSKINRVVWNKGKKLTGWRNSGSFKKGGVAPLKGRKRVVTEDGKVRYIRPEETV